MDETLLPAAVVTPGQVGRLCGCQNGLQVVFRRRYYGNEGDDPYTSYPCGSNPPEEQTVGEGFYIIQDRSTGGGEAGNALEKSVHGAELPTIHHIGDGPEKAGKDPGESDDEEAFASSDTFLLWDENQGEKTNDSRHKSGIEQRYHRRLAFFMQGNSR